MTTSGTRVDVDDSDARILYSDDWSQRVSPNAFDRTLHYALQEGSTASLTFNGTMVSIMGCAGDVRTLGVPSISVLIDGTNYNANVIPVPARPGPTVYNVTRFTSPTLTPGEHTVVLTNLNATPPNLFVFDRFWYIAADVLEPSPSGGQSTMTNTALPSSNTSTVAPAKSGGQNNRAIIGGAVGGTVALLLAGLALVCFIRRRSHRRARGIDNDVAYAPAMIGHRPQLVPVGVAVHQGTSAMVTGGLVPTHQAHEPGDLSAPASESGLMCLQQSRRTSSHSPTHAAYMPQTTRSAESCPKASYNPSADSDVPTLDNARSRDGDEDPLPPYIGRDRA